MPNMGNKIKSDVILQTSPSREFLFNFLAVLVTGEDPKVMMLRDRLDPAPSHAGFRSLRRATGMGADQDFEPAIAKLGSDLMSDAASFIKTGTALGSS
jgi:hypothetical protein